MPIEINALESARFGVVAARVRDPEASPAALDAAACRLGVQMLMTRVDCAAHSRIHALEASGFRLMDSLVHYERSLAEALPAISELEGLVVRRVMPQDVSAVADVARAAFSNYIGHYHADPRINRAAADAAYVEWAETSAAQPSEMDRTVVVLSESRIAGFLMMRLNSPDEVQITLNAVDPALQRRGLYTRLVSQASVEAREMGASRVVTSTQINNFPVQRAWIGLGFRPYRCCHTFHKWFGN